SGAGSPELERQSQAAAGAGAPRRRRSPDLSAATGVAPAGADSGRRDRVHGSQPRRAGESPLPLSPGRGRTVLAGGRPTPRGGLSPTPDRRVADPRPRP